MWKEEPVMTKTQLIIPNISCNHCVNAIKNDLGEMQGVTHVTGDPKTKTIDIEWTAPATLASIRALLQEINYPAE